MMKHNAQLIIALDVDTFDAARMLVDQLSGHVDLFKIGSQLFTACGPMVVRYVMAQGKDVFLDLKYHDIPNTVANAMRSVVNLNKEVHEVLDSDGKKEQKIGKICLCTVHIQGGKEMLVRAVQEVSKHAQMIGAERPLIIGITVLTSEVNGDNIQQIVIDRAKLAQAAGLDGVVASAQEVVRIRQELGDDFKIITPGIRPSGMSVGDQKRVATPLEAIKNGSNYLVVGRPVVKADDPVMAVKNILAEFKKA